MQDWFDIGMLGLLGLGCVALGRHLLRQPARAGGEKPEYSEQAAAEPVPNTLVAPLPEHRQVALLEFDGPPGRVVIKPGETVIGRHSEDDVSIPDVRVSRRHARLEADGAGGFEIRNLTATRSEPNPMQVNGRHCETARISDGDVITLGGVSFRFHQAAL